MTRILTIDDSGRIQIPPEYLSRRGTKPGQKVVVIEQNDGSLILKVGRDISELFGILSADGLELSLEEIQESIEMGGAGL